MIVLLQKFLMCVLVVMSTCVTVVVNSVTAVLAVHAMSSDVTAVLDVL